MTKKILLTGINGQVGHALRRVVDVALQVHDRDDAFVAGPDEFRPRLTAREEQYLELWDYEPPFIINGAPRPRSPTEAWARGVAYVPQERRSQGLMMQMGSRPNAGALQDLHATNRTRTQNDFALRAIIVIAAIHV